jgi:ATP-dependent DNA helicase RecG
MSQDFTKCVTHCARFHLPDSKSAIMSPVIAATIETCLIKPVERVGTSRKVAPYLPFWA